jgi:hypothetical protein
MTGETSENRAEITARTVIRPVFWRFEMKPFAVSRLPKHTLLTRDPSRIRYWTKVRLEKQSLVRFSGSRNSLR